MYNIALYYEMEDESIADELSKHLNTLGKSKVKIWTAFNVFFGEELLDKIEDCQLFMFLVSVDSLNTLAENEIYQKAVELDKDICLVLARSCNWEVALAHEKHTILPSSLEFIATSKDSDGIYTNITTTIQQKIKAHNFVIPSIKISKTFNNKLKNSAHVVGYFTGRVDKLKEFKENYKQNNFFLIEGGGGIGKTQFCAKCIEENDIKREKVLWFDCEARPYFDLLVEQAGFPQILKGESKRDIEKVISFIAKMNEHGLILFLENYQDAPKELFNLFLKHAQTTLTEAKVIVISRDKLGFEFQPKKIKLSKFDNQEALEYCKKVSQHVGFDNTLTEEEIANLSNRLKGHPLAIYLAFVLLERGAELEDILAEILESESSEIVTKRFMNALFDRTDTSEVEKDFILKFAAFRGAVSVEEVNAVFNKENARAARKLCNKNILQLENKHYSLHPLVREYCYQKLENKETIHQQVAEYYLPKREAILDVELENKIYYHLFQAKDTGNIEKTVIDFGRKYIEQGHFELLLLIMDSLSTQQSLTTIFYGDIAEIRGEYDKAIAYYQQASKSSEQVIQVEGIIKHGEMLFRRGDAKGANPYFERALVLCQKNSLKKEEARALNDLGLVQYFYGNYEKALEYHDQSLNIRKTLGNQSDVATSLNNIGIIYSDIDNYEKALEYHDQSLNIRKTLGNQSGLAMSLNNIGSVYHHQKKYDEALRLHKRSLIIYETLGDQSGIASALNKKGDISRSLGKNNEALRLHKRSLVICEILGDQSGIASAFCNIGAIYTNQKKQGEALVFYKKSLEIYRALRSQSGEAISLNGIGVLYSSKGDYEKAIVYYKRSLEIQQALGRKSDVAACLYNMGWAYYNKSDHVFAMICYLKSIVIDKGIGRPFNDSHRNILTIKQKMKLPKTKEYIEKAIEEANEAANKTPDPKTTRITNKIVRGMNNTTQITTNKSIQ